MIFNGREYATSKEAYAAFLETEFWRNLRRLALTAAKHKCSRCWRTKRLQAHHHRYPDNWYDSTLADLEVLCKGCHKAHHGLKTLPENWFVKEQKPRKKKHRKPSSRVKWRHRQSSLKRQGTRAAFLWRSRNWSF